MISSGKIDWPKLIAAGERLGISVEQQEQTCPGTVGGRVVIRQLNALKCGVSEIRHTTRVSFWTSPGGADGGIPLHLHTLDFHWGEVMILRAQWVG